MKKLVLLVLVMFVCSIGLTAQAQKPVKEIKEKSKIFEKTRGTDENIKTARPTTDVKVVEKEKTRGALCTLYINNYSGYSIDIYIDGDWMGTIAAYSTAYTYAYSGTTKAYGKSIGGTMTWGPTSFDCKDEYKWNLWE
jgi:hypothetical protein